MDMETGKIYHLTDTERADAFLRNIELSQIDEKDMTDKQKKEMQVSPHDTKSILGRKFASARAQRKAIAKMQKHR